MLNLVRKDHCVSGNIFEYPDYSYASQALFENTRTHMEPTRHRLHGFLWNSWLLFEYSYVGKWEALGGVSWQLTGAHVRTCLLQNPIPGQWFVSLYQFWVLIGWNWLCFPSTRTLWENCDIFYPTAEKETISLLTINTRNVPHKQELTLWSV